MAGGIDLSNYETVEERLIRFKKEHPDYRIETELVETVGEVGKTRWVMKATVWKHHDDDKPAATGWAFEVDGVGMAQRNAALETCETSAIGRALANLGFVGNKRVTRQEMLKTKLDEIKQHINNATGVDEIRELWNDASHNGVLEFVKDELTAAAQYLGATPADSETEPS